MNPEYTIYQEIDRYLRDEMSAEESTAFARRIAEDPDVAATYEAQKAAHNAIIYQELSNLKQQLKTTEKKVQQRQKIKKYSIAGITLSAAIAIGVVWMIPQEEEVTAAENIESSDVFLQKREENSLLHADEGVHSRTHTKEKSASEKTPEEEKHAEKRQERPAQIHEQTKKDSTQKEDHKDERVTEASDDTTHSADSTVIDTSSNVATLPDSLPSLTEEKKSCDLTKPEITTNKSCIHKATGSVEFHHEDETLEYSDNHVTWKKNNAFHELSKGQYTFYFRKDRVCSDSITIEIKTKRCQPEEVTISPYFGERWEIPVSDDENATLTILNGKGGGILFEKKITNGSPAYWEGTDQKGNVLAQGTYVYIIKFGNGDVIKGRIGILTN